MPSENKKVRNAVVSIENGIEFKSVMEARVYRKLLEYGIQPEYEPEKIVILEGFRPKHLWFADGEPQKKKQQDITYTPDFRFKYCGHTVYLEVKGFMTDRYPLKRKMFLNHIDSLPSDIVFAEVRTIKGLVKTLEQLNHTEQPETPEGLLTSIACN